MSQPILRWAGGKRWAVPLLGPSIYDYLEGTGGCYVEPFLGGGAMALYLGPRKSMVLADGCLQLMDMYKAVQTCDPAPIHKVLNDLSYHINKDSFVAARHVFNDGISDPVEQAATFIYLNKTCFNGLYRENSKGQFNVPFGDPTRKDATLFPSLSDLKLVKAALQGVLLCDWDFETLIDEMSSGDLVYADPPYDGAYDFYIAARFGFENQTRLAEALKRAAGRGVAVVAHNANTEAISDLYAWADLAPMDEKRLVAADADARQEAQCLIITANLT